MTEIIIALGILAIVVMVAWTAYTKGKADGLALANKIQDRK